MHSSIFRTGTGISVYGEMNRRAKERTHAADSNVLKVVTRRCRDQKSNTCIGRHRAVSQWICAAGRRIADRRFFYAIAFQILHSNAAGKRRREDSRDQLVADVTVVNSENLNTSVILANGNKRGKVAGDHTLCTSSGSTTTTFSLVSAENQAWTVPQDSKTCRFV